MRKSRQNALGAVPQDPLTLKLRLDTNDVNIVRTAPQIRSQGACGAFLCEVSASQSQKVTLPRLWVKQAVTCPDGPFPASGEGAGGAEPSAASGGCSEAEHPQRSKRTSKRAARSSFRVPQGGGGKYAVATFGAHLCAVRICFSRLFREKQHSYPAQLSVKGVCKGESLVPLCPVLLPFAGAKGRPPRRAVLIKPCKRPCPAEGEMKLYHNYCRQPLSHGCAVPAPLTQGSL